MSLLKASDADAVRRRFQKELINDVTVTLFTASPEGLTVPGTECEYCETTQHLLEAVAALDPRIHLKVRSIVSDASEASTAGIERVPAILVSRNGETDARFYGIPAGFEFSLLIEDIVAASRGDSGLSPESRMTLAGLTRPVHIQVFVTPTCPYCPKAGRLAHAMALESPKVRADVVEVMEFPALGDRYGVFGVPKVVINETDSFEGALPEAAFLQYVVAAEQAAPASTDSTRVVQ